MSIKGRPKRSSADRRPATHRLVPQPASGAALWHAANSLPGNPCAHSPRGPARACANDGKKLHRYMAQRHCDAARRHVPDYRLKLLGILAEGEEVVQRAKAGARRWARCCAGRRPATHRLVPQPASGAALWHCRHPLDRPDRSAASRPRPRPSRAANSLPGNPCAHSPRGPVARACASRPSRTLHRPSGSGKTRPPGLGTR